jgi:glycosyltransferase A (GT-A) superfamily protein (DUF2064 family)
LTTSIIDDAFESLSTHDAVIGPANDGGYYLIGFRKNSFEPGVFREMTWSTDTVYRETRERFLRRSLMVHVLPHCTDVDTVGDLKAFLAEHAKSDAPDSRTLALLKSCQGGIFR